MKLSMSGNRLAVQTPFSKTHNLLQIFSNIGGGYRYANNPVEFHLAALQRTEQTDIWHPDVLLAYATDEAAPVWINGGDIGGNHGCECVVEVTAAHDKTCADIGSLWKDDAGLDWTLLRVVDGERLWFLSENTGASKTEYAFASAVSGKLTYASCGAHPSPVVPERQQGGRALTSSNRHLRTDVFCAGRAPPAVYRRCDLRLRGDRRGIRDRQSGDRRRSAAPPPSGGRIRRAADACRRRGDVPLPHDAPDRGRRDGAV